MTADDEDRPRRPVRNGLLAGDLARLDEVSLSGSRCRSCGETTLGTNPVCPNCGGDEVDALPLGREGVLWSFTVVRHRPPGDYAGPEPFVPFGLGLVELPEGLRVMSPLAGDPAALRIGLPMRFTPRVLADPDGGETVGFAFAPTGAAHV